MQQRVDPTPILEPDAIFDTSPRFVPDRRFRVRPAPGHGLGVALLLGLAVEHPRHPGDPVPQIIWRPRPT
ncbi:MAG: hypothetical protein ACOCV4_06285 [Myxococcota bacterium]